MKQFEKLQRVRIKNYDETISYLREKYFQEYSIEDPEWKKEILKEIETAQKEQLEIIKLGF